ncbi:MAG: M48 family metallopeptidase [Candidatus Omnitrophica bacterium]|nr:M48 family metallopeptidase [Candidatus Omnitrophota bacterium]
MDIKIIRSPRRRLTVSARQIGNCLLVRAPENISEKHLEKIIGKFKIKFERKRIKEELDKSESISEIARRLNEKYFANALKINSIEYVTTQNSKYGCCNYSSGRIRISHKVGRMPVWVRDYVIIHEMAHLLEPNHSKEFWDIVCRYALCERARGYLMAAGIEVEEATLPNAVSTNETV